MARNVGKIELIASPHLNEDDINSSLLPVFRYSIYNYSMEEKRISDNASCFLVKDERLKSYRTSDAIYDYLTEEGFKVQKGGSFIEGIDWLYINIYSKVYAKGRAGIALTKVVGDHAITFDEFKTIYGIFKKYENLRTLIMNEDNYKYF